MIFPPSYVLPCSLGLACVGLAIWNVRMTGTIHDLGIDLGQAKDDVEAAQESATQWFKKTQELEIKLEQSETTIQGYQQDVDTLREERRVQEQKIDGLLAENEKLVQDVIDRNAEIKQYTGMINTLNSKIPKRDESGKFKKKK